MTSPKLLTEFLDFKLPTHSKIDKAKVEEETKGLRNSEFKSEDLNYFYISKSHADHLTERIELLNLKVNESIDIIKKIRSDDARSSEDVRSSIVRHLTYKYDKIILFSILYSFIFLWFNGCNWKTECSENDGKMLLLVSYFLFFNTIIYMLLLVRSRYYLNRKEFINDNSNLLRSIRSYLRQQKLRNGLIYILMVFNLVVCYSLIKFKHGPIVDSMGPQSRQFIIVNYAWILNAFPIILLSLDLHKYCLTAYTLTYGKKITSLKKEMGAIENNINELYKSTKTNRDAVAITGYFLQSNSSNGSLYSHSQYFLNVDEATTFVNQNTELKIIHGTLYFFKYEDTTLPILFDK